MKTNNFRDRTEYNKQYYQEHKDNILERAKKYHHSTPDKQRERSKKWHDTHRELANLRSKQSNQKVRKQVIDHYGGKCECCGETHIEFLAIDHINGNGRKHRLSIPSGHLARWLRDNNYPEGFRILCHNCNQSLGHYGYCPHKSST
jgi:hypothetical protein